MLLESKVKKGYHQHCGLARALDRVGERWTLLIVREMLLGPRRYKQLLEGLQGITTNLLAKKLKDMESDGILEKQSHHYRLTELGASLEPVIMELARWGGHFMQTPQDADRFDLGWALLSLKRRYQGGEEFRVGISLDEGRSFELLFEKDHLWVQEREAVDPHLRMRGSQQAFFAMLFQNQWHLEVQAKAGALEQWCRALKIAPAVSESDHR